MATKKTQAVKPKPTKKTSKPKPEFENLTLEQCRILSMRMAGKRSGDIMRELGIPSSTYYLWTSGNPAFCEHLEAQKHGMIDDVRMMIRSGAFEAVSVVFAIMRAEITKTCRAGDKLKAAMFVLEQLNVKEKDAGNNEEHADGFDVDGGE